VPPGAVAGPPPANVEGETSYSSLDDIDQSDMQTGRANNPTVAPVAPAPGNEGKTSDTPSSQDFPPPFSSDSDSDNARAQQPPYINQEERKGPAPAAPPVREPEESKQPLTNLPEPTDTINVTNPGGAPLNSSGMSSFEESLEQVPDD
jgi:hypothetical protein